MTPLQLPCPVSRLVPHRPPMRWLDELVGFSPDCGTAEVRVPSDHLLTTGSREIHPLAAIELIAQAAAAHEGYRRLAEGRPVGGGFLTGVRDFTASAAPEAGRLVTAVARRTLSIGDIEMVHGHVECEGRRLAEGDLAFFLSDDLAPDQLRRDSGDVDEDRPVAGTVVSALHSCRLALDHGRRIAVYRFPNAFPAFAGHFPGFPILPAVVAVVCAAETVALFEAEPITIRYIKHAKFSRPIPPGKEVEVVCSPAAGDAGRLWRLELGCDGVRAAVMTIGEARTSASGSETPSAAVTGGDRC